MGHLVYRIMIEVLVRNQHKVRLELVFLSEVWVDVDNRVVVERESVGAVSLK